MVSRDLVSRFQISRQKGIAWVPSDKPLIELINAYKGEICTTAVHFVNKDEFEYFIFDNLRKQNQDDNDDDDDINSWLEVAVDDFKNINQEKKRQRKEKIF